MSRTISNWAAQLLFSWPRFLISSKTRTCNIRIVEIKLYSIIASPLSILYFVTLQKWFAISYISIYLFWKQQINWIGYKSLLQSILWLTFFLTILLATNRWSWGFIPHHLFMCTTAMLETTFLNVSFASSTMSVCCCRTPNSPYVLLYYISNKHIILFCLVPLVTNLYSATLKKHYYSPVYAIILEFP